MKQVLVFIALTVLGIIIFGLVAGPNDSLKTTMGDVWQYEIDRQADAYP